MDIAADFLAEIEAFMKAKNMSESRFGVLAMSDGHFVKRIRRSGNVTTKTVLKVRSWMASELEESAA